MYLLVYTYIQYIQQCCACAEVEVGQIFFFLFFALELGEKAVCKRHTMLVVTGTRRCTRPLLLIIMQVGHVGLWTVDDNADEEHNAAEDVFQFKPHTGAVPRLTFDPQDQNKMISTSYDGTVRRMDVEKGAFEEVRERLLVAGVGVGVIVGDKCWCWCWCWWCLTSTWAFVVLVVGVW